MNTAWNIACARELSVSSPVCDGESPAESNMYAGERSFEPVAYENLARLKRPAVGLFARIQNLRRIEMESWYKVATPRKEVQEDRSFNPNEFVIALSALYPKGSEEKRLLDAMLLAVPR